ncbi:prevent-host-death family protein [Mycolicibacterium litorale]|nr:prevent-host-death family protein [Mycolicibacterium litorale]
MAVLPVRVLNQETAKVLARVKAGEEIILTERGTVIARLVPASPGPLDDLVSAGRVRRAATRGPAPRPTVHVDEPVPDAGTLVRSMRDGERY